MLQVMYWIVAAVVHHISCVLLNTGLYFLVFFLCRLYMYVPYILCLSNPAVAAKSNKPLLSYLI